MTGGNHVAEEHLEGFLELSALMSPLLDFVEGQRAEYERRGFSPSAAEAMAVTLYMHTVSGAFRPPVPEKRRRWWSRGE